MENIRHNICKNFYGNMFWNIPTHASSADAKGQMEVYDSNKNNYDDNDNYNDNYNDLTEMAMMMALTRFPPPSHMSSYVGTCSTARASLTPTTAPAPYTYPYPYPKSSVEKVTANWDISTKICAALLNGMEKSFTF